uniref:Uncharacterized protein n=1 Tax=viral metagenome TaxID=1070528 RepID=A0A6C0D7Z1_9ZZZZ
MDIPGSEGINVYADAKVEYTRQLTSYSLQAITGYFLKLLEETKESEKDPKKLLFSFQNTLKGIPDWNQDKVQKETGYLLKEIKCDYFEDLLSAVFVAHTKVLSAIRLTSKQKKLQITIPKVEHFLHHTMIECARILWSNVYLFSPNGTAIERQRNLRQIEQLIQDGILQSIRSMLPVKNILKEYLKEDEDEEVEEVNTEEIKIDEAKEAIEIDQNLLDKKSKSKTTEEIKEETKKPVEITPVLTLPTIESEKKSNIQEFKSEIPIIEVDTEPSVKFSDVDTVFSYEKLEGENNSNDSDSDSDYSDSSDRNSFIEILDTKGEPLNDFEDLEKKEETIEFETLG